MKEFKAYINGQFIDSPKKLKIVSPLDNQVVGILPSLDSAWIDKAFLAAQSAWNNWKTLSQKERNKYLTLFDQELLKHKQELAQIMHLEIGKDVVDSTVEIERTSDYLRKTISAWEQIKVKEEKIGNKISHQLRLPLGVVLAISPFNYPVNLSLAKIIPALISGNTVVFKGATNGSLTGGFIAKLFDQIKIPKGVFNYVSGAGKDIGDILVTNKHYDMISFTGGIQVGKKIASHSNLRPMILELGGNDAAYVRQDADLEIALKEIFGGAFGFAGQRCTAIKRLILHQDIAKPFLEKLINKAKQTKVNSVINQSAANYLKELYEDAKKQNDEILLTPIFKNNDISIGLIKTTNKSRLWNEEQFGPILPIMIVQNDKEALALINDSTFGLQNSLFTSDLDWALEVAPLIESGSVNINGKSSRGPDQMPFLGIKNSGWGVQGIYHSLFSMTRIHNIVINK